MVYYRFNDNSDGKDKIMWMMTEAGMFSAVAKPGDTGILVIRTRCLGDIVNLCDWVEKNGMPRPELVYPDRRTDYPHRIELEKEVWALFIVSQVEDATYTNFKSRIAQVNPHHEHVYHSVWAALLKIEDEDDPRKMKAWKKQQRRELIRYTTSSAAAGSPVGGGYGSLFSSPELGRDGELEPDLELEPEPRRGLHDLTDDEWTKLMSEAPY